MSWLDLFTLSQPHWRAHRRATALTYQICAGLDAARLHKRRCIRALFRLTTCAVLFFAYLRDPRHYLGGCLALAIGRFDTAAGHQALSGWIDFVCRRR